MKRIILTIALIWGTAAAVAAQPRSAGIRIGENGVDAVYQHKITRDQFIEGNAGLDFGYSANGDTGFKVAATYNFIWARPAWTEKGSWALYAGPGAAIGAVQDMATIMKDGKPVGGYLDMGFMLALTAQVGIEYNFEFPLQIAVDVRPCFGMHINDGRTFDHNEKATKDYGSNAGFYDNGLAGFIPSVSIRYRF